MLKEILKNKINIDESFKNGDGFIILGKSNVVKLNDTISNDKQFDMFDYSDVFERDLDPDLKWALYYVNKSELKWFKDKLKESKIQYFEIKQ